jgi:tRNA(adenine34) deaminase
MRAAIDVAKSAPDAEVPVGAIIVYDNNIISIAHNERETSKDPTAHAEILALRRAGQVLQRWNLHKCDMYVTLEPCVMCAGAIVNSRISSVYYGAVDSRFGAVDTTYKIGTDNKLNHKITVVGGVLQHECSALLTNFFGRLRANK